MQGCRGAGENFTQHSLLITQHSLLITQHSSLITHHSVHPPYS
ncbi:hypothetical protein [Nostoc sp. CMAA1605]|nr:hypothetical protein [Nostoc sp. CMAA1605]